MARAALRSRPSRADHEARLARAAAAGDERALATLYGRYRQRAFNLAFRITGSQDHAARATGEAFLDALHALPCLKGDEPGFGSCLFTATRNASWDLIEQRPPAGDAPEPFAVSAAAGAPETAGESARDLAFEAVQDQIRGASLRLPKRSREVLALGALDELSYGAIAAIMDADGDSAPEMIARARIRLHDELFGTKLAAADATSEECEQALPLIAMRDDGQLDDEEDVQWLLEHLARCGGCRLRLDAMQEASAAYGAWQPVAAPPELFGEVMAAAAQSTSPDRNDVTDEREAKRSARVAASALISGASRRRGQRNRLVTAGLLFLALLGASGVWAGATLVRSDDDRPKPTPVPSAAEAELLTEAEPAPVRRPKPKRKVSPTAKANEVQSAPPDAVVIQPPPAPGRNESASERRPRRGESPRRRRAPLAEAVPLPKPKPKATPPPPTSQPAPPTPPAGTPPQLPPPQPSVCKDATGKPVPCPR